MKNKFAQLVTSRKFWAATIGLGFLVARHFNPDLVLPNEDTLAGSVVEVIGTAVVVGSYIIGTAVEDAGRAKTEN